MSARDLLVLLICCCAWGGNFVLVAWAAGTEGVPPLMLAAVRAAIVLAIMFPFLFRPRPELFGRMLLVAAFIGPLHLAFLYTGLSMASASGGAIVSQMLIPMSTLLAVVFLGERLGWRRSLAIAAAFAGTVVILWEPGGVGLDLGLLIILAAYLWIAIGSILMRSLGAVDWRIYVAWTAVLVLVSMSTASLVFESDHIAEAQAKWFPLVVSALYAALAVSIFAHGQYFRLLGRYPVSVVIPVTLLVPVITVALGILFLDETLTRQILFGAALILPGVYVIAKRDPVVSADHD